MSNYKDSALKNYLNRRSNVAIQKTKLRKCGDVEIEVTECSDDAPKILLGTFIRSYLDNQEN